MGGAAGSLALLGVNIFDAHSPFQEHLQMSKKYPFYGMLAIFLFKSS